MSEEDGPTSKVAIGIAFGNSYSSIAWTTNEGKAEVIANEDGDRQIPSMLSYVDGEELHGTQAKAQLIRNPKNTIAYFRDFLGKDFKSIDPTPCHASAHPFKHNSAIAFSIRDTESEDINTVPISKITTRYLCRLKNSATDYLGKPVSSAVVTVSTNFTDTQKVALTAAAKEAGIEVLQYINEPVATVLAYDARPDVKITDKIVVVADLGGTRSDVAVVASRGGIYSILATVHDYDATGAHLDQVLMDYFAKEFLKKFKKDPRENERSLAKLKAESEAVKKALSLGTSAAFSVESLIDGIDYTVTVNRTRYELLANKLFGAFTRLVLHAVEKADLDVLDINEIILAGGTSHTPKIAKNLELAFPSSVTVLAPVTSPTAINPSELNARGAAIQASLIADFDPEDIEQSTHAAVTVTPHLSHAIGVLLISGDESNAVFRPLIEANTAVPVRRTANIAVPVAGGDVLVKLCEGLSSIKVTKPESKPKTNGQASVEDAKDSDDDDDDDSEEEEEEAREKVWKCGKALAETSIKGVKKGARVEVQVNVDANLAVSAIVRELGGKGGVRVTLDAPKAI